VTRNVYVIVLAADQPSPLAPESDEENSEEKKEADKSAAEKNEEKGKADAKKEAKKKEAVKVRIDLDGLSQRILCLPVRGQKYQQLVAGKPGLLFLVEGPLVPRLGGPQRLTVHKFDLGKRKTEKFVEGATGSIGLSHNGEKLLCRQDTKWFLTGT